MASASWKYRSNSTVLLDVTSGHRCHPSAVSNWSCIPGFWWRGPIVCGDTLPRIFINLRNPDRMQREAIESPTRGRCLWVFFRVSKLAVVVGGRFGHRQSGGQPLGDFMCPRRLTPPCEWSEVGRRHPRRTGLSRLPMRATPSRSRASSCCRTNVPRQCRQSKEGSSVTPPRRGALAPATCAGSEKRYELISQREGAPAPSSTFVAPPHLPRPQSAAQAWRALSRRKRIQRAWPDRARNGQTMSRSRCTCALQFSDDG